MPKKTLVRAALAAGVLYAGCITSLAVAQTSYTIITPLSFGQFATARNDSAYDLIVDIDNNTDADTAFIVGSPAPQRGEILIEGLDPFAIITLSFVNGSLSLNGNGNDPKFTVRDFTNSTPLQADGSGALTVYIGATLRSNGSGAPYPSGPYSGSYDLTIDF